MRRRRLLYIGYDFTGEIDKPLFNTIKKTIEKLDKQGLIEQHEIKWPKIEVFINYRYFTTVPKLINESIKGANNE